MKRPVITEEYVLHMRDRALRERRELLRELLIKHNRPDLLAEFDAKTKAIDNGIDGAMGTWNALSLMQRRVLQFMGNGYHLRRDHNRYTVIGHGLQFPSVDLKCRIATARNLCARELIAVDGGAFDPEAKFVITERGRFVLRHSTGDRVASANDL